MSIGPMSGILASAAGAPLPQAKGTDVDQTQQADAAQLRQTASEKKADAAAGIGQADGQDHETADRDADGRLPWKFNPEEKRPTEPAESDSPPPDPSGAAGNLLDLSG
ncbi:MAG: hypothetical protein JXB10_00165 [Pirellulales bacterium]|nr:hypothetical protein [Pirellulales bacterium]